MSHIADPNRAALDSLLGEAEACSDEYGSQSLGELRRRLKAATVRLLLAGEAKRGKSTLGNALLGRDVLPVGVRPVTAVATTVSPGSPDRVIVEFRDGHQTECSLEELATYVTESANPENERNVASVQVVLDQLLLPAGVLVDTPGIGSVFTHNTHEAHHAMTTMDLAVFVLTADPPISDSERQLLETVRGLSVASFVVLNKADHLSSDELADARAFVTEVTGVSDVFVCSARAALTARLAGDDDAFTASGVRSLLDAISARLEHQGQQDLLTSVGAAARRVIDGIVDRVTVTKGVVEAFAQDRQGDVDLFLAELPRATDGDRYGLAETAWEKAQFRRRLDEDANRAVQVLSRRLHGELTTTFNTPVAEARASVSEIEVAARAHATKVIAEMVGAWRQRWLTELEGDLAQLTARQQSLLDQSAERVRDSAQRLLGAAVHPRIEALQVPDVGRFSFDFSPRVGWNTAMVEGSRRLLPPRWRYHLMRRKLAEEVDVLVDRQVGRARSDVQRRLESALREQGVEVTARFHELRDGLGAALAAADHAHGLTAGEYAAEISSLAQQVATLTDLRTRLQAVAICSQTAPAIHQP